MSLRHLAVSTSLGLFLVTTAGCPSPSGPDASVWSFDAGNPSPRDACSGGCAENQRCDTVRHECVDGCGGCDGAVCVKAADGTFSCQPHAARCGETSCEAGQIACVGGACACVSALNGAGDSCGPQGKWCDGTRCVGPTRYEQCVPRSTTASCPSGYLCDRVFSGEEALCVRDCSLADTLCERGERCLRLSSGYGCLPLGLFVNQDCTQNIVLPDGGLLANDAGVLRHVTVPVSNTCLVKDVTAAVIDEPGVGNGNCTYAIFKYWARGVAPYRTCRPGGSAKEGDICRVDYSMGSVATQCGPGLECMRARNEDQGICFRMCNANPPSGAGTSEPSCEAGEACVNLYRYSDPNNNAVVGVCLKTCNVFDAGPGGCPLVGGHIPTSCVPTSPAGDGLLTVSGEALCVPQHPDAVGPHAACAPADPFRGAACGSAQLCHAIDPTEPPTCLPVCDLDCDPVDGGAGPQRCASEPSGRCEGGTSCHRVSSSPSARVGFCW